MLILTPNPRYRFTVRDNTDEHQLDDRVVAETWVEDVYRIRAELNRGSTMIDIGANIGAVSVFAASLGAHVVAVEPEPHNAELLELNIKDNHVDDRVIVHRAAVSDRAGRGWINNGYTNAQLTFEPVGDSTEIPVITLADVYTSNELDTCDVLKIDVEGAECDIIAGADSETLRRANYITLEFDGISNGIVTDEKFGAMVTKLAKDFAVQILGSPQRGGYLYCRRYELCDWG